MAQFINSYVLGCQTCQQVKVNTHPTMPGPGANQVSERPFQFLSMDFIMDLPKTKGGYNVILTVVDQGFSKMVRFIPCKKTMDAGKLSKLLLNNIFTQYGLPDKIISDRGPQFALHLFQETCKALGITLVLSTAFHPQTDGESEHVNQELKTYLQIKCGTHPQEWINKLSQFEWFHNLSEHTATKETPFKLVYGYTLRILPQAGATQELTSPTTSGRLSKLRRI